MVDGDRQFDMSNMAGTGEGVEVTCCAAVELLEEDLVENCRVRPTQYQPMLPWQGHINLQELDVIAYQMW